MKFIYLEVGGNPKYQTELFYSSSTLLAEVPESSGNIVVYTDRPCAYEAYSNHLTAVDISDVVDEFIGPGNYFFRIKPCIILQALQQFACPCIFLDTDTFVRSGFSNALRRKFERGAVMDQFCRKNPFPECEGLEVPLPSGLTYRYDHKHAAMYNSGIVAASPEHISAILDSISIIDAIRPMTRAKDQEQFAIGEALRIHGIHVSPIGGTLKHYWSRWQKRYMHHRFESAGGVNSIAPHRPRFAVNKIMGQIYKYLQTFAPMARPVITTSNARQPIG